MAKSVSLAREQGQAMTKGSSLRTRMRRGFWGYLFVSPWILIYAAFGLYPLLLSFYLTFFTYSFVRPEDYVFVGIGKNRSNFQNTGFFNSPSRTRFACTGPSGDAR